MARRMVQAGHEVTLVTAGEHDHQSSRGWSVGTIGGVTVHSCPVPYSNYMSFGRRLSAFFRFAFRASLHSARLPADVIFASSTPLTIAIPAVYASRKQRAPMVFEVRDLWPEVPIAMGALKSPVTRALAHRLERWAYRNADRVVALSPGMSEGVAATGYPVERISVIPNSSDQTLFDVPDAEGEEFRKARNWLGERPLVIYAGTLGKVNDVGFLVRVAHEMRRSHPEIRFLVVGNGAERDAVIALARETGTLDTNVFFEDPRPKSAMPALLSAATVCTSLVAPVPELRHNSANKFFDALAAGRPIAINHGGWQEDLLVSTGAGIRLSLDPARAAEELAELIRDDVALGRARAASKQLSDRYSRDRLARDLVTVLEAAAKSQRSSPAR